MLLPSSLPATFQSPSPSASIRRRWSSNRASPGFGRHLPDLRASAGPTISTKPRSHVASSEASFMAQVLPCGLCRRIASRTCPGHRPGGSFALRCRRSGKFGGANRTGAAELLQRFSSTLWMLPPSSRRFIASISSRPTAPTLTTHLGNRTPPRFIQRSVRKSLGSTGGEDPGTANGICSLGLASTSHSCPRQTSRQSRNGPAVAMLLGPPFPPVGGCFHPLLVPGTTGSPRFLQLLRNRNALPNHRYEALNNSRFRDPYACQ